MNTSRDPRELVVDLLGRSICSVQVVAVAADKHGIFSWGWNSVGAGYGLHAEHHCILRANRERLRGATLYVASMRLRNGRAVTSKPCKECQRLLDEAQVKTIYYRDKDNSWQRLG